MFKTNRRDFLKTAGTGVAASSVTLAFGGCQSNETKASSTEQNFELGMASYTLREFSLTEAIKMTNRLNLKKICLKSMHLPLQSGEAEIRQVAQQVKDGGLDLYGCGVVYMSDEDQVNRAFIYAKTAGMKTIIGVPEHNLLNLVNEKVKEFDIQVAIHNHGPGDQRYPTPESAILKIKELDPRIGLCVDIGHTQRSGVEPAETIALYKDRVLDIHMKDVSSSTKEGSTEEIGRGVINIPKVLETLLKINYNGVVSFEHEKDGKDPLAGVAESVGFVRGVLRVI